MQSPADALKNLAAAVEDGETGQKNRPETPAAAIRSGRAESPIVAEPTPKAAAPAPRTPPEPAPPAAHGRRAESPILTQAPDNEPDESLASASALAELSGTTSAAYDPGQASATRRRRVAKPDMGMMQFRAASVPVLITFGLIMGALGLWGVMIKTGSTALPLADRPEAGNYATVALVGLPLALCLVAGAGFFFYQYRQDQKKLAAYEEAKKTQRRG